MSNRFDDFLNELLQDPEVRVEYNRLEPEFAAMQAIIDARYPENTERA